MSSPLLSDIVSPHPSSGTTLSPTHGPCKCSRTRMARGECCRHTAAINTLLDSNLLEIFAFCLCVDEDSEDFSPHIMRMRGWQRLVHVCQRWRQIIYASALDLDLLLYCSDESPVRTDLSCWPAFLPIAISYRIPDNEDDVIALLKHSDRVRAITLQITSSQCGKVFAAMQGPFAVLTNISLQAVQADGFVLPSGFLGGSRPCLQAIDLRNISFPELPTLLLSAPDLVTLLLEDIPPTCYISPEAMVASLALLTKLETLSFGSLSWPFPPEQGRRRSDPPMRAVLPVLTDFEFRGRSEYLEDLLTQIDATRLKYIRTEFRGLDFLRVPQLFLLINRTESLRFRRAWVEFTGDVNEVEIDLRIDRDQRRPGHVEFGTVRPHFSLCTSFEWTTDTHVAHMAIILSQIFTTCSRVEYLEIRLSDDHPGWRDYIDRTEWLAFFSLLTTVEKLYISGTFAEQVACALEDVTGEMVTEVLPSLQSLALEDTGGLIPTEQFVSLRQLYGRPVTIHSRHNDASGFFESP